MLIEHRIDDVKERLIRREKHVAAGQDITFRPAFERVLAEHFHNTPISG